MVGGIKPNALSKISTNLNDFFSHLKEQHKILNRNIVLVSNIKIPIFYDIRPVSFRRLFDNLINNAFSYSNGEVLITLKKNKDSITISILDDGPGIPAEEIKRLLKPFERLDEARGNTEGCGLGLAIAERITQSHDGKLTISNRTKKGLEVRRYEDNSDIWGVVTFSIRKQKK